MSDRWFDHPHLLGWLRRERIYQQRLVMLPFWQRVHECRRVLIWCLMFPESN